MQVVKQDKISIYISRLNKQSTQKAYAAGLNHFKIFVSKYYPDYTSDTIIDQILITKTVDVYQLLDNFVYYLKQENKDRTPKTISNYIISVKGYLGYFDVEIADNKFKRRVKLPPILRDDEEAIDVKNVRKLLLKCNIRRLKPIIMILASNGARIKEVLSLRYKDVNFDVSPTEIHIRKEYSKTRKARKQAYQ